ncbi:HAD-like protein [Linderina pennispora]|uniref:HAD-like protein n=1 Tax=Linderina pennispora TaxID=61395 RepID=A0A1Y1VV12_9FUNG|nr:HAD-like protein [Linderina pennispora]ORX65120.1 HAD-like protein [Linderina pennispora]
MARWSNTIDCVERFWRHKAVQYNINADELLSRIHGFPTLDVLKTWFPAEFHNPEGARLFESEIMHDADASLDPKKWTIVTAATEDLALCRLGQVDLPVPAEMVSAKNVARGKPDPQCYQMGAKVLGIEPSEALVFEDAVNGTKAGHAAGATVVGVLTSTPEQALKDAGAKYVIQDFANVRVEDRATTW